jgi:hypothetical protein
MECEEKPVKFAGSQFSNGQEIVATFKVFIRWPCPVRMIVAHLDVAQLANFAWPDAAHQRSASWERARTSGWVISREWHDGRDDRLTRMVVPSGSNSVCPPESQGVGRARRDMDMLIGRS